MLFKTSIFLAPLMALGNTLQACQQELEQTKGQMQEVAGQAEQLQNQCNQQIQQLQGAMGEKDQAIAMLQQKLDEANDAKKKSAEQVAALEKSASEASSSSKEVDELKKKLEEAANNAKSLEANIKNLQKDLETAQSDNKKASEGAKKESASLSDSLKKAEADVAEANKSVKKLQEEKKSLVSLKKAEADVAEANKSVKKLQEEKKSLVSKLSAAQAEHQEKLSKSSSSTYSHYIQIFNTIYNAATIHFSTLLYSDEHQQMLKAHYVTALEHFNLLLTHGKEIFADVSSQTTTIGLAVYEENVYPLYVLGRMEATKVWNEHLAETIAPVMAPVLEAVEGLDLTGMSKEGMDVITKARGEISIIATEQVLPVVYDLSEQAKMISDEVLSGQFSILLDQGKAAAAEAVAPVTAPIDFEVLGEKIVLNNGFLDAVILGLIALIGGYFIVYKIILKVLVYKIFLKFLVAKVAYNWLFRGVLLKCMIGLSWKVIFLAFSILIFTLKLAFCCGCCGLCLRKNKLEKANGGKPPQKAGKPLTTQKPNTPPKVGKQKKK